MGDPKSATPKDRCRIRPLFPPLIPHPDDDENMSKKVPPRVVFFAVCSIDTCHKDCETLEICREGLGYCDCGSASAGKCQLMVRGAT